MINKLYIFLFILFIITCIFFNIFFLFKLKKKTETFYNDIETVTDLEATNSKLTEKANNILQIISTHAQNPYSEENLKTEIKRVIKTPVNNCPQSLLENDPPILFLDNTKSVQDNDYENYDFTHSSILGKYPNDDSDWLSKYSIYKQQGKTNPVIIRIPTLEGLTGKDGSPGGSCQQGPPGSPGQDIISDCRQGIKGDTGPQGVPGEKGTTGDDCYCTPGSPGPRGLDGIPGIPGISSNRLDAENIKGNPGPTGDKGTDGIPGLNCKYKHELDYYLLKYIHSSTTGLAFAPYIKITTNNSEKDNMITEITNLFTNNKIREVSVFIPDGNIFKKYDNETYTGLSSYINSLGLEENSHIIFILQTSY